MGVIVPLVQVFQQRLENEKCCYYTGQVSWMEAFAKKQQQPFASISSSKCILYEGTLEGKLVKRIRAPSVTEPLTAAKATEFHIKPSSNDLCRVQYERLVPFFVTCWVEKALLLTTDSMVSFLQESNLALDGFSVHDLLSCKNSPFRKWYMKDETVLKPIFKQCNIQFLSNEDECLLSVANAKTLYNIPEEVPRDVQIVFISMHSRVVWVLVVDGQEQVHTASFQFGRNHFKGKKAASDAAVAQRDEFPRFVRGHLM